MNTKHPATIYIDGENFLYQIVDVLVHAKLISERAELAKFDIISLFMAATKDNIKPINVRYYGTKLHLITDMGDVAQEASQKMVDQKRMWGAWLAKQGVEYIIAGNLKARKKNGEVVFQEKGVDVTIAVDMIVAAYDNPNMHFIVATSDSDIIPALRVVAQKGHKITYIGNQHSLNKAIVAHANETITFNSHDIIECFKKVNS